MLLKVSLFVTGSQEAFSVAHALNFAQSKTEADRMEKNIRTFLDSLGIALPKIRVEVSRLDSYQFTEGPKVLPVK